MKSCYLYNYMSFSVFRAYIFCRYLVVNSIFKNSQHNQQIITILHELPFYHSYGNFTPNETIFTIFSSWINQAHIENDDG